MAPPPLVVFADMFFNPFQNMRLGSVMGQARAETRIDDGRRKSVQMLNEPAGEPRVQRAAPARPARRGGLAVDGLEVPEFLPSR